MDSQEIKVQPDQQKWSKIKNFGIFEISSSKSSRKSTIKYKYLKSGKLATPVLTTAPSEFETFKLPMTAVGSALLILFSSQGRNGIGLLGTLLTLLYHCFGCAISKENK